MEGTTDSTRIGSQEVNNGNDNNNDEDEETGHNNHPAARLQAKDLYPNRALQRIMEEYMESTTLTTTTATDSSSRRVTQIIKRGMDYLAHHSSSLRLVGFPPFLSHDRPLPEPYYCPITFDLFHTPVIDPEGNTYEQAAIVPWIRTNGTSPLSRTPLSVHQLYPNHAIRRLLEYHASEEEEYEYDEENQDEYQYQDEEYQDEYDENDDSEGEQHGDEEDDDDDDQASHSSPPPSHPRRRRQVHPALLKWKTEEPPTVPDWNPTNPTSITSNSFDGTSHHQQQQQLLMMMSQQQQPQQNHPYPTTWEELELYRQAQQRVRQRAFVCTFCSFLCFLAALGLAVWYGGYCIFVTIWLGCCVRDGYQRYRTLRLEQQQQLVLTEERILQGQQRREQLQARLNQLRLQEAQELQQQQQQQQDQLQPQDENHPQSEGESLAPLESNQGDIEMGGTSSGRMVSPTVDTGPTRTTSMLRMDPSLVAVGTGTERQLQEQIDAEEQAIVRRRYQERLAELLSQDPPSSTSTATSTAAAVVAAPPTTTPTTTNTTTSSTPLEPDVSFERA
jgi:U-box domain